MPSQKFNQELRKQPSDFVIYTSSLHTCKMWDSFPVKKLIILNASLFMELNIKRRQVAKNHGATQCTTIAI